MSQKKQLLHDAPVLEILEQDIRTIHIQKYHIISCQFTYPFTSIIPCASQHFLKGPDRQGLFKDKITDAKVWRNIL